MKKGLTLIELTVAMAIFTIVVLVAVAAFITVSRTRSLTGNMRESQQKLRVAEEKITRLARQAEYVLVGLDGYTVTIFFNTLEGYKAYRFSIKDRPDSPTNYRPKDSTSRLYMTEEICSAVNNSGIYTASNCSTPSDIVGGNVILDYNSKFQKNSSGYVPKLSLTLNGSIRGIANNPYYSDQFNIVTSVVLENLK